MADASDAALLFETSVQDIHRAIVAINDARRTTQMTQQLISECRELMVSLDRQLQLNKRGSYAALFL